MTRDSAPRRIFAPVVLSFIPSFQNISAWELGGMTRSRAQSALSMSIDYRYERKKNSGSALVPFHRSWLPLLNNPNHNPRKPNRSARRCRLKILVLSWGLKLSHCEQGLNFQLYKTSWNRFHQRLSDNELINRIRAVSDSYSRINPSLTAGKRVGLEIVKQLENVAKRPFSRLQSMAPSPSPTDWHHLHSSLQVIQGKRMKRHKLVSCPERNGGISVTDPRSCPSTSAQQAKHSEDASYNHRLYMRQYAFLVVRPRLSSSNPNFSKPSSRAANSDFWSRLAQQLLGRLKSTIPYLQLYL